MYVLSQEKFTFILKLCGALAMLMLLAACGGSGNTSSVTPTTQSGTVAASTPGVGPIIVQDTPTTTGTTATGATATTSTTGTPGATSNSGQVVKLADRTLTIRQVSKQAGSDASTTGISLTITVTNTSPSPIMNEATFYQLEGAEGDSFGTQSSVSANFYGAISSQGSRQGTIVFQVPTGAVSGIHLLFRPEVATDTALIPLNL